jgi:hypothetical protein
MSRVGTPAVLRAGRIALIATSRASCGCPCAVDDAEGSLADLLDEFVPTQPLARGLQRGVVLEDPLVQAPELLGEIQAELFC